MKIIGFSAKEACKVVFRQYEFCMIVGYILTHQGGRHWQSDELQEDSLSSSLIRVLDSV